MNNAPKIAFPWRGELNLICTLSIPIILGAVVLCFILFFQRKRCLDSPASRRWGIDICEEYVDGEWVDVDFHNSYQYNEAGETEMLGR